MNEFEAQKLGYMFVGPTCKIGQTDNPRWKESLQIAKSIKKEYTGADYIICSGTATGWLSQTSRAIYGNDIFNEVWDLTQITSISTRYAIAESRLQKAKEDYEAAMKLYEHEINSIKEKEARLTELKASK